MARYEIRPSRMKFAPLGKVGFDDKWREYVETAETKDNITEAVRRLQKEITGYALGNLDFGKDSVFFSIRDTVLGTWGLVDARFPEDFDLSDWNKD